MIMPQRTKQEIESEIAALEACKKYIPKHTSFGENNHVQLDLQIEALKFGIDTTCEEWWDFSERDRDAITQAQEWKEGNIKEAPSSDWNLYNPKRGIN